MINIINLFNVEILQTTLKKMVLIGINQSEIERGLF